MEIWNYAKENNLIILTKDANFTALAMLYGYPPKIIHFKIGNLRINDFYNFINKIWPKLDETIESYNIINVFNDRIEAIK